ncbi:MAG: radical SAM protein [Kiritimatiellae bacterium]|nr:radical SAM protein [Kiritimatiellia bacterium]
MADCTLCPRMCGSRPGYCGAGDAPRVFRWGPHFGEEPPLTGKGGSGCVFFSRCTMKCLYCQNSPWSWRGAGEDKTVAELTRILRTLAVEDRCENWNLVSPTPYLPQILEAAKPLFDEGVRLPFVWNSSGYERVETLEEYSTLCDWALFDLRYSRDKTAMAASGAAGYVKAAREAARWAWRNKKLICRILVLPGLAGEAIENLSWLAGELSNEVAVSIMSQYTPAYKALETPPFDRCVSEDEYASVVEAAEKLGFCNGWTQGFESADPELAQLGENMPSGHGPV